MNSNTFLTIAYKDRDKLDLTITRYIHKYLKVNKLALTQEELEVVITEAIIRISERLKAGDQVELYTDQQVYAYIAKACLHRYINAAKKVNNRAKFDSQDYLNSYYSQETPEPVTNGIGQIYLTVFEYVYSKYSFLEASLFKAYIVNKISNKLKGEKNFNLKKLSEMSGYTVSKCHLIIKKIKEDLKQNKNLFLNPE